jgi:hypothetical protein
MTRLRCVLVWKAHRRWGTQTESVRRARSRISRSNWGLHCCTQYKQIKRRRGFGWGANEKQTHVARLECKTFFDRFADVHTAIEIAIDDVNLGDTGQRRYDSSIQTHEKKSARAVTYNRKLPVFQRADDSEVFVGESQPVHLYCLGYSGSNAVRKQAK